MLALEAVTDLDTTFHYSFRWWELAAIAANSLPLLHRKGKLKDYRVRVTYVAVAWSPNLHFSVTTLSSFSEGFEQLGPMSSFYIMLYFLILRTLRMQLEY